MDVARLISEVYKRNGIWDHRTSSHYMRDAVASLWYEIADVLDAPVDAVKAKWRNLRDTYTAECRKMYKRSLGKEPMIRSKWVWFSSMDFLRPHLKRLRESQEEMKPPLSTTTLLPMRTASALANRRMRNVLKAEEEDDDDDDSKDGPGGMVIENVEVDDSLLQAVQHLEEDDSGTVVTEMADEDDHRSEAFKFPYYMAPDRLSMCRKRTCIPINPYKSEADKKRTRKPIEEELSVRDVDDTFHFLISLREPLKSLTIERQMFVRYKIQELLFNETNEHHKQLQSLQTVENVETTPEIICFNNIKVEPTN